MTLKDMKFVAGCITFFAGILFGSDDSTVGLEFVIFKIIAFALIVAGFALMEAGNPYNTKKPEKK